MKQQELAEALNVSQQSISRYENGKHYPDLPALIEIADYFDVPLDYLVGRTWPKGPVSELYVDQALAYEPQDKDAPLRDGKAGAEAHMLKPQQPGDSRHTRREACDSKNARSPHTSEARRKAPQRG